MEKESDFWDTLLGVSITKLLGPLEEYIPKTLNTPAKIRIYSTKELKDEGIPTTEIILVAKTFKCRNYSLRTLEDMGTVTRASEIIRTLGLKPMEQYI